MKLENINSKIKNINIKLKSIKISTFLFFIAWTIFLYGNMFINVSETHILYKVSHIQYRAKIITIILLSAKFLIFDKNSLKRKIIYICFVLLYNIQMKNLYNEPFMLLLIVFSSKGVDFEKFIKYDLINKVIMLLCIFSLCYFGLLTNYTSVINGNFKQALGFAHPNTFGIFVIMILLEYIYILKEKINIYRILLIFMVLIIASIICKARTSIFTFALCFVIYLITLKKTIDYNKSKALYKVLELLPLMLTIISFVFIFLYSQNIKPILKLNDLLTGRLSNRI